MTTRAIKKSKFPGFSWSAALRPVLFAAALFYLAFHALHGDFGLYALLKENRRLETLEHDLKEATAERELLENKTKRMKADSLDLDLLDEQSRRVLGLSGDAEIVYFPNNEQE